MTPTIVTALFAAWRKAVAMCARMGRAKIPVIWEDGTPFYDENYILSLERSMYPQRDSRHNYC